jgi:hypothetical protein
MAANGNFFLLSLKLVNPAPRRAVPAANDLAGLENELSDKSADRQDPSAASRNVCRYKKKFSVKSISAAS